MVKEIAGNNMKAIRCRNCSSEDVSTKLIGKVNPFFLKRVYGLHAPTIAEQVVNFLSGTRSQFFKKLSLTAWEKIASISIVRRLVNRRPSVMTNVRVCKTCGFVGPEDLFSFEELNSLYADYRSSSYNLERCYYEPGYESLQGLVGKSAKEVEFRLGIVDTLLNKYIDLCKIKSVLDWGGGEGRFIPNGLKNAEVIIFDISTEVPFNDRYKRISSLENLEKYDFVQVCHVLEHVSQPLEFIKNVVSHLNKGGYLYIEVPQDRDDQNLLDFEPEESHETHVIHEHLNLYSKKSISAIGEAAGLKILSVEVNIIDYGLGACGIVSGLYQKV